MTISLFFPFSSYPRFLQINPNKGVVHIPKPTINGTHATKIVPNPSHKINLVLETNIPQSCETQPSNWWIKKMLDLFLKAKVIYSTKTLREITHVCYWTQKPWERERERERETLTSHNKIMDNVLYISRNNYC